MLVLLRLLPFTLGAVNAALFLYQARSAETYPWPAVIATVLTLACAFLILRKRGRGMVRRGGRLIVPSVLTLAVCGYALLLAEGVLAHWVIPLFAAALTFAGLELFFLSTFVSARYPVNGLSHLNLSLVPAAFWLTAFTSVGITVFINGSRLIPVCTMTLVAFAMFYWTSHPEAGPVLRRRWALLGAWLGFQLGLVGAVLPVDLLVHGTLAALCGAFAVRVRRYGIVPPLPRKLIIAESLVFVVFLAAVLATARWV
jgi:hypothetical protein